MKQLFTLLLGMLLLAQFSSCTVQKRVHRKGWHVEWKRHYKNDRSADSDEALRTQRTQHTSETSVQKNASGPVETFNETETPNPVLEPVRSTDKIVDTPTETEVKPSNARQVQEEEQSGKEDRKKAPFPRPGISALITMFILFSLFITLVSTGGFIADFIIILLGIAWAGVVLGIVMRHFRGRSKKEDVPYANGFYNVLIYLGLTAILTAYLIGIGALADTFGLIVIVFLFILMALLVFLLVVTKKKGTPPFTEEEKSDDQETVDPDDNLSPEEKAAKKKKTTRGLLIFSGILVAAILAGVLLL